MKEKIFQKVASLYENMIRNAAVILTMIGIGLTPWFVSLAATGMDLFDQFSPAAVNSVSVEQGTAPSSVVINPDGGVRLVKAAFNGTVDASSFRASIWGLSFTVKVGSATQFFAGAGTSTLANMNPGDTVDIIGAISSTTSSPVEITADVVNDRTTASASVQQQIAAIKALIDELNAKIAAIIAQQQITSTSPLPSPSPSAAANPSLSPTPAATPTPGGATPTPTASNNSSSSKITFVQPNNFVSVTLFALPNRGPAPLNVSLQAFVNGEGGLGALTEYQFACGTSNSVDLDITSSLNPFTANNLCTYTAPGVYTAAVFVNRGGSTAENETTITVQ